MTSEEKAAYVNAQAAAAMIEAMGMQAMNQKDVGFGYAPTHTEEAFNALIERYGLHSNALIMWFRD